MMKAIRNLRTTSTYSENLPDPTPAYEPSPKYEPPAEKYNPAPNSIPASNHHPPLVLKEEKTAWTKWTIPEGDQITIYRPVPTDHSRYTYTVNPIPNIPTGGRVHLSSATPITIEYRTSSPSSASASSSPPTPTWDPLPACLKDCALCAPSPRKDGQYPFLPIFTFPTNTTGEPENPFTPETNQAMKPKFCTQAMLHRAQRSRTKTHAKLETACEECGWCAFSYPLPAPAPHSSSRDNSKRDSKDSLNVKESSSSRTSVEVTPNPQLILDASTRSKDPASREMKKSLGGWISDRFIFESHVAPTVREHRTFLGCWVCWEHEGVWREAMEPGEWWAHLETHFKSLDMGGEGYRLCIGENGWMNKRESCPARNCPKIHS